MCVVPLSVCVVSFEGHLWFTHWSSRCASTAVGAAGVVVHAHCQVSIKHQVQLQVQVHMPQWAAGHLPRCFRYQVEEMYTAWHSWDTWSRWDHQLVSRTTNGHDWTPPCCMVEMSPDWQRKTLVIASVYTCDDRIGLVVLYTFTEQNTPLYVLNVS